MFTLLLTCALLASCSAAEPPNGKTRAGLTAMYGLVLAGHDTDGDGKLSQREVEAMLDASLADDPQQAPGRREMRDWLIEDFAAQDLDRDGYLDLAELLKQPLATFTCLDANSDDTISEPEIQRGMGRCGTDRAYVAS